MECVRLCMHLQCNVYCITRAITTAVCSLHACSFAEIGTYNSTCIVITSNYICVARHNVDHLNG